MDNTFLGHGLEINTNDNNKGILYPQNMDPTENYDAYADNTEFSNEEDEEDVVMIEPIPFGSDPSGVDLPVKYFNEILECIPVYPIEDTTWLNYEELPVDVVGINSGFLSADKKAEDDETSEALFVDIKDIVPVKDEGEGEGEGGAICAKGYGLRMHGNAIRAYGYRTGDGDFVPAGEGLKDFFKKIGNAGKKLLKKGVDAGKKVAKKVGTTLKDTAGVAMNALGNTAKNFIESGALEQVVNGATNAIINKGTNAAQHLVGTVVNKTLKKGKGIEDDNQTREVINAFENYYDYCGGAIRAYGLSGAGKRKQGKTQPTTPVIKNQTNNASLLASSSSSQLVKPPAISEDSNTTLGTTAEHSTQTQAEIAKRTTAQKMRLFENDEIILDEKDEIILDEIEEKKIIEEGRKAINADKIDKMSPEESVQNWEHIIASTVCCPCLVTKNVIETCCPVTSECFSGLSKLAASACAYEIYGVPLSKYTAFCLVSSSIGMGSAMYYNSARANVIGEITNDYENVLSNSRITIRNKYGLTNQYPLSEYNWHAQHALELYDLKSKGHLPPQQAALQQAYLNQMPGIGKSSISVLFTDLANMVKSTRGKTLEDLKKEMEITKAETKLINDEYKKGKFRARVSKREMEEKIQHDAKKGKLDMDKYSPDVLTKESKKIIGFTEDPPKSNGFMFFVNGIGKAMFKRESDSIFSKDD